MVGEPAFDAYLRTARSPHPSVAEAERAVRYAQSATDGLAAFTPPTPSVRWASVWTEACDAATEVWREVADHPLTTPDFAAVARANVDAVAAVARLADRLPRP